MRAQPKASHFIGGANVEDATGKVFNSHYPATGEVIAKLHSATPAIVEQALAAAADAQAGASCTARRRSCATATESFLS